MNSLSFKLLAAAFLCIGIGGIIYDVGVWDSKDTHNRAFRLRCDTAISNNAPYVDVTKACTRHDAVLDRYEQVDFWLFSAMFLTGGLAIARSVKK